MHADAEKAQGCLVLPVDASDVYGKTVVAAGTDVTPALLADVAAAGRFASTCRLNLKGSRLRKDMEELLGQGPYPELFPPGRIDDVLRIYDELRVLPVLFEEFELMRTRDAYVYEHVLRTAAITASMAIDLFGKDRAPLIGYTALTHDIGMVRLPDDVLKQDIGVDRQKRRVLYGHTLVGYVLLTYYLGSAQFGNCRVALEHHERGNGVGYPRGIKLQDQITELIGTADAFDALLSVRPFRKEPFELRAALDTLWYEAKLGVLSSVAVKLLIAYSRSRYEAFDAGQVIVAEETRHRAPAENNYINWADYQHHECGLTEQAAGPKTEG
jgi:HD-GYP domain-containing protein (c-di-GMP phosphodiesterase class II)